MLRAGLLGSPRWDGPALNQGIKTKNYRVLCWRELAVIPIHELLGFPWLRTNFLFSSPTIKNIGVGNCREVKEVFSFFFGLKILECRVHKSKAFGWSIWKAFEPFASLAQLEGFACSRREKDKKRFTTSPSAENESRRCTCTILLETAVLGAWVWGKRIPGFSPRKRHVGG